MCESSRHGTIACLVDAIAGEIVRGTWWSHPQGRTIFAITRAVRAAPDVLTCRLVDGKITFVHARLWPALLRAADGFAPERLARIRERHAPNGRHVIEEEAFPQWVDDAMRRAAALLDSETGLAELRSAGVESG